MHDTSFEKMAAFVDLYLTDLRTTALSIVDFGSRQVPEQTLNYRTLFDSPAWSYAGIDLEAGTNVDVVVQPFEWPVLGSETVDLVISGQAFEHADYFWMSAFEMGRALKPGGMIVLIAPSRGPEHRFPVDCWRFYPDGFRAVCSLLGFELLEIFTDWDRGEWADSLVVMRKPKWSIDQRQGFLRRHQLQLAVVRSGLDPDSALPALSEIPPSPLLTVSGGDLTPHLERIREADTATGVTHPEPALRMQLDAANRELERLREFESRPSVAARAAVTTVVPALATRVRRLFRSR